MKVKGILLENFHRSWRRSHQWLFSSWSKCDSQQRDDGLNWEVCVPAVCTKDIYLNGERAEMVAVSKEASPVGKATTNPSCKSSNLNSSLSTSTPETFGLTANENGWVPVMTKLRIPPATDAITYFVKCKCAKERCSTKRCQCRKAWTKLHRLS